VRLVVALQSLSKDMLLTSEQVAYLMADIADVQEDEIRDLFQSLEELSSRIRTRALY
jgi:D-3-phosphoglycerate dehydrogenase / 2-oxoglutarate reductase